MPNPGRFVYEHSSPGEIVSIFGSGIGPISGVGARLDGSGRVASNVAGARVLFDGVPAPLFFVRSDQINAQAPYSLDGKDQVRVQVMFQCLYNQILAESGRIFKSSTSFGEREFGDDVELLQLQTHSDHLSPESCEVVLVGFSDLLDQAVHSQTLHQT